jgi:hypothetical protein
VLLDASMYEEYPDVQSVEELVGWWDMSVPSEK